MASTPDPSPSPNPNPNAALNSVIKALIIEHGEYQATDPPTITYTITAYNLASAGNATLTISPQPANPERGQPEPFILITVTGV